MKKFCAAVVAAALTVSLITAAPVLAQEKTVVMGGSANAGLEQSENPPGSSTPNYRFDDGFVYIDGDMVLDCPDFAASVDYERTPTGDIPPGVTEALEGCVQAGLLPSSVVDNLRASAEAPSNASAGSRGNELPETGGSAVLPLTAALAILLIAGGSIACKVVK